jgi:hypothetical protein
MRTVLILVGRIIAILGPNLIGLNRSTVRIENHSQQHIQGVVLLACEKSTSLGTLAPGTSQLHFLPSCGVDTLEIHAGSAPTNCPLYVEGETFHVRARVISPTCVECSYGGLVPFWPFLIYELF